MGQPNGPRMFKMNVIYEEKGQLFQKSYVGSLKGCEVDNVSSKELCAKDVAYIKQYDVVVKEDKLISIETSENKGNCDISANNLSSPRDEEKCVNENKYTISEDNLSVSQVYLQWYSLLYSTLLRHFTLMTSRIFGKGDLQEPDNRITNCSPNVKSKSGNTLSATKSHESPSWLSMKSFMTTPILSEISISSETFVAKRKMYRKESNDRNYPKEALSSMQIGEEMNSLRKTTEKTGSNFRPSMIYKSATNLQVSNKDDNLDMANPLDSDSVHISAIPFISSLNFTSDSSSCKQQRSAIRREQSRHRGGLVIENNNTAILSISSITSNNFYPKRRKYSEKPLRSRRKQQNSRFSSLLSSSSSSLISNADEKGNYLERRNKNEQKTKRTTATKEKRIRGGGPLSRNDDHTVEKKKQIHKKTIRMHPISKKNDVLRNSFRARDGCIQPIENLQRQRVHLRNHSNISLNNSSSSALSTSTESSFPYEQQPGNSRKRTKRQYIKQTNSKIKANKLPDENQTYFIKKPTNKNRLTSGADVIENSFVVKRGNATIFVHDEGFSIIVANPHQGCERFNTDCKEKISSHSDSTLNSEINIIEYSVSTKHGEPVEDTAENISEFDFLPFVHDKEFENVDNSKNDSTRKQEYDQLSEETEKSLTSKASKSDIDMVSDNLDVSENTLTKNSNDTSEGNHQTSSKNDQSEIEEVSYSSNIQERLTEPSSIKEPSIPRIHTDLKEDASNAIQNKAIPEDKLANEKGQKHENTKKRETSSYVKEDVKDKSAQKDNSRMNTPLFNTPQDIVQEEQTSNTIILAAECEKRMCRILYPSTTNLPENMTDEPLTVFLLNCPDPKGIDNCHHRHQSEPNNCCHCRSGMLLVCKKRSNKIVRKSVDD